MRSRLALAGYLLGLALAVPGAAQQAEAPEIEIEAGGSAERVLTVRVDTAPVVTATAVFWGENWGWVGTELTTGARNAHGAVPSSFHVPDLGIAGEGALTEPRPNALRWEWALTAERDVLGGGSVDDLGPMAHGGLAFNLDLTAPARRGCTAEPVLRDDRRGWSWEVAPGQTVTVSFDEPLAELYFERGQKTEIRAMFYWGGVQAGPRPIAMQADLPEGGLIARPLAERYAADSAAWPTGVLDPHASPVDLSGLNHKPAGKLGRVRAEGDQLVYGDGSPARFWGVNLQAYSLYVRTQDGKPDRALIERQARRLAELGVNLVRLTHIDSDWVEPNLIAPGETTDRLDDASLDGLFTWIEALRAQGIYILLDMITYRPFKPADGIPAFDELVRHNGKQNGSALGQGFNYLNPRVTELWRTTSRELLTRTNPYSGLALKDDPAMMGIMLWNENDLTQHFGNLFLGDKDTPQHRAAFLERLEAFAERTGLDRGELDRTWLPGPSKALLAELEYEWYRGAVEFLRGIGVESLICVGHVWGGGGLYALPSLAAGDVTDSHTYSASDFLSTNPHYTPNFAGVIARSQQAGRPSFISEFNMEDSLGVHRDAFTVAPYIAALGAFQGWDAPMLYGYSQDGFGGWGQSLWSSYSHPSAMALMPAAALLYRQGHVAGAKETLYLDLTPEQLFLTQTDETTSRTIRTGMERHRLVVGMPATPELPWLEPTAAPAGARVVTDLDEDLIPPGNAVTSDTGELSRDWVRGIYTIDTPRTQMALGWLGGEEVATADARFALETPKAGVALSSLDDRPLRQSTRILLSTCGRVDVAANPVRSELVAGTVELASDEQALVLIPLGPDGTRGTPVALTPENGRYRIALPTAAQTLWFLLEPPGGAREP